MKRKHLFALSLSILIANQSFAQNQSSTMEPCEYINANHEEDLEHDEQHTGHINDAIPYIRLYGQNDFFKFHGLTDRYYTNGEKIDVFTGAQFWKPAFLTFKDSHTSNNNFGFTMGMDMYTPTDIGRKDIDTTDRPYAGYVYFGIKCISNEFALAQRLTTEYTIGLIGPQAKQKEVQTWLHDLGAYRKPNGWDYQIKNELTANVNLQYERLLFNPEDNIEGIGGVEMNLGTVMNYVAVGGTIRIGAFNDYFLNESGLRSGFSKANRYVRHTLRRRRFYCRNMNRGWQAYLFVKPYVRMVLNNSLLQGGVFTYDQCIYTIDADDIKRVIGGAEFGFTIQTPAVGLSFSQQFRSAEFINARTSQWGSIAITIRLPNKA